MNNDIELYNGDCLEVLPKLADNSVDLILTDPPYYKVKGDAWDRQWDKPELFLKWLDSVLEEFYRVLKPNGSLYLFASPQMSARVECLIGERFEVNNCIRWAKEAGWHQKQKKDEMRKFQSPNESIIFAEHKNAESFAKGEAGYSAKCDELRGFVFEPLRLYLVDELYESGKRTKDIAEYLGVSNTMVSQHYFSSSQWGLPTHKAYKAMQAVCPSNFKREYEELRKEYEELRRPFYASPDRPYTDVWTFKTVQAYKGKHPCEKPHDMLEHIIQTSSRPDSVVLDAFMGSGSTGTACKSMGRKFIGIEMDSKYFNLASDNISKSEQQLQIAI